MQIVKHYWCEPMQFVSVRAVSDADAKPCGYIAIKGTEIVEIASNPQNLIN